MWKVVAMHGSYSGPAMCSHKTKTKKKKSFFFATHTTMSQQPHLRLGSTAPDFKADTTNGPILFHEYIGDSWAILFSHPAARTSVCSTELSAFAKLQPEFTKRGVKLLAISADPVEANSDWIDDMEDFSGSRVKFPIIADAERKVATLYDMIDHQDATNLDDKGLQLTIRAVFIIDPSKKIRLIMTYPASTGRNTAEVLRVLDSLQLVDKQKVITPINWVPGDDVLVHMGVPDDEARVLFPKYRAIKPYIRLTPLEKEDK